MDYSVYFCLKSVKTFIASPNLHLKIYGSSAFYSQCLEGDMRRVFHCANLVLGLSGRVLLGEKGLTVQGQEDGKGRTVWGGQYSQCSPVTCIF